MRKAKNIYARISIAPSRAGRRRQIDLTAALLRRSNINAIVYKAFAGGKRPLSFCAALC
jgi:ribosomal 50S subunit-associated protein YjgA (DUF615 family)